MIVEEKIAQLVKEIDDHIANNEWKYVDFRHLRDKNNKMFATVCEIHDTQNTLAIGISLCSDKDNFSRKMGRRIAMNRAFRAIADRCNSSPIERMNCPVVHKWVQSAYFITHNFHHKSLYFGEE
jgi:hypothetical protein